MTKTAFVLGANGLIGNAICFALGGAGIRVVPAARDSAALSDLRERMLAAGLDCPQTETVDATDDDALSAAIARTASAYGIDIAVNNVGRGHRPAPLTELDAREFDDVVAVNFRAVAVAMRNELRELPDGGALVNIVSSAGTGGAPGMSAYSAAKHAVVGLTRTAAIDYAGRGIRVNAVAPGPIESGPVMNQPAEVRAGIGKYVPMGRMGRPDEVAAAVLWLATDASSYTTGLVLPVDGGKKA
jgi:NAD(P)-dependent dehydrogenase (short-subunit alcohol dehydrogenase family)